MTVDVSTHQAPAGQVAIAEVPAAEVVTERRREPDPAMIQSVVQRLRLGLLGGRGPGADEAELLVHQRGRALLGALPCATERAIVALQTRAARGDLTLSEVRLEADRIRRSLS